MITFKEYLVETKETIKITGKAQPYEKLLYKTFISWMLKKYNNNSSITLKLKKPSNSTVFGIIDLLSNKNVITVESASLITTIPRIAHEMTHILQKTNGKLKGSDDNLYIMWNNKKYISVVEYNKITDITNHEKLPWEKEAYKNQKSLQLGFYKSDMFLELIELDPTLKYLYDNNMM